MHGLEAYLEADQRLAARPQQMLKRRQHRNAD